jgi:adenosylcobinamide kinase/adenosylcobinamide-phosphate guanylyltransferase
MIVLDCLTLWTGNLLLKVLGEAPFTAAQSEAAQEHVLDAVLRLLAWQSGRGQDLVIVSNEVGLGVVPPTPLGRLYRDVLGRANQAVAARAQRVYLVVAGLALELRGAGATQVT